MSTSYSLLESFSFVGPKPSGGFSNNSYSSALEEIHGLVCDIFNKHESTKMSRETP
jgi:hypothetical protein